MGNDTKERTVLVELKESYDNLDRTIGCLTRASVKCNSKQRPAINICIRICETLVRSLYIARNEGD